MKIITEKRPPGRPRLPEGQAFVTVSLRLTQEMLDWIDEQGVERFDRPNRSTVARECFAREMSNEVSS